jgi:hypothetical protein
MCQRIFALRRRDKGLVSQVGEEAVAFIRGIAQEFVEGEVAALYLLIDD